VNPAATVRFLRLSQNDAAPALSAPNQATLDNLFVQRNTGGGAAAVVELGDASVLRDSVVWTHRGVSNVIGVLESPAVAGPNGSDLRNVTVSTQGSGSSALAALGTATGSATLTARNVIARGGPGGYDLLAAGNGVATAGTIDVGYSNYLGSATLAGSFGAISDAGANQTTVDPSFSDAAAADFHERPGSPTVDQGTAAASLTGSLDLDGYPRSTGSAPDIGAYERPLPLSGATDSADGITATRATLHGTFDSQGRRARAYFQFGTGTGYGEQTVSRSYDAAAGTRATSGGLVDLRPDHVYHYRLVAVSEGAVARGADRVFRTKQACVVPSLTRLTLSRARRALAHAHCALGRVTSPRSRTRRTLVVSGQRPGAESIRAVGTRVAVKLAPRR
jgi:hypothetical protein